MVKDELAQRNNRRAPMNPPGQAMDQIEVAGKPSFVVRWPRSTRKEVRSNREFIDATFGNEFYKACLVAEPQTFLGLLARFGKI